MGVLGDTCLDPPSIAVALIHECSFSCLSSLQEVAQDADIQPLTPASLRGLPSLMVWHRNHLFDRREEHQIDIEPFCPTVPLDFDSGLVMWARRRAEA